MSDSVIPLKLESARVRTFSFYIHDVRYSVPTLKLVQAADEGEARLQALALLDESVHHSAVEVLEEERTLFRAP